MIKHEIKKFAKNGAGTFLEKLHEIPAKKNVSGIPQDEDPSAFCSYFCAADSETRKINYQKTHR